MSTSTTNGSDKPIVLITGANQGLGYYAAQQMASTGYHVLVGSRDVKKAEKAIEQIIADDSVKVSKENLAPIQIDVNSDDSIQQAAKTVQDKYGKLDILMNNAGIALAQAASEDGRGPTLRELYQQKSSAPGGKRISFTSSGLASLDWGAKEGMYSAAMYPIYRSTKTAMSMIVLHYAMTLENEAFVVSASDPGYCGTNLNGYAGFRDPRQGAVALLVKAAVDPKDKVHGKVIDDEGTVEPW
ncbi:hypothetical protein LTR53_007652 [Teratosphaeriaceae sp. CCFEE 6253]|nr:hypothetical protein LTR53_007652 [Teratosphaeriaceae sp. CCFEE 6253]